MFAEHVWLGQPFSLKVNCLDCCVVSSLSVFWLLLALYYPPEDNVVQFYVLEEVLADVPDIEAYKLASKSIQLQVIKHVRS